MIPETWIEQASDLDWDVQYWIGIGILVEALRLAQVEAEARRRRWWDTMHVVLISSRLEEEEMNGAVVVVAGAALGPRARRVMSRVSGEVQRELDRRRVEIGNDHDRDYRDRHGNDLKTARIVLVLVVVPHLEALRSNLARHRCRRRRRRRYRRHQPHPLGRHRLRQACEDRHPRH
jgi:hypothetical protein